jgi:hypothetical protein
VGKDLPVTTYRAASSASETSARQSRAGFLFSRGTLHLRCTEKIRNDEFTLAASFAKSGGVMTEERSELKFGALTPECSTGLRYADGRPIPDDAWPECFDGAPFDPSCYYSDEFNRRWERFVAEVNFERAESPSKMVH